MAFWDDFLKEDNNKEALESVTHKKKEIQIKPILKPISIIKEDNNEVKIDLNSNFVGMPYTHTTRITRENTIDICPTCNKRYKITQDKSMNKDTIIDWFTKYLTENKQTFTLDWLRGQKLTFESVNEMRK